MSNGRQVLLGGIRLGGSATRSMEVKHVEAYGDSLLVVQQVAGH